MHNLYLGCLLVIMGVAAGYLVYVFWDNHIRHRNDWKQPLGRITSINEQREYLKTTGHLQRTIYVFTNNYKVARNWLFEEGYVPNYNSSRLRVVVAIQSEHFRGITLYPGDEVWFVCDRSNSKWPMHFNDFETLMRHSNGNEMVKRGVITFKERVF